MIPSGIHAHRKQKGRPMACLLLVGKLRFSDNLCLDCVGHGREKVPVQKLFMRLHCKCCFMRTAARIMVIHIDKILCRQAESRRPVRGFSYKTAEHCAQRARFAAANSIESVASIERPPISLRSRPHSPSCAKPPAHHRYPRGCRVACASAPYPLPFQG